MTRLISSAFLPDISQSNKSNWVRRNQKRCSFQLPLKKKQPYHKETDSSADRSHGPHPSEGNSIHPQYPSWINQQCKVMTTGVKLSNKIVQKKIFGQLVDEIPWIHNWSVVVVTVLCRQKLTFAKPGILQDALWVSSSAIQFFQKSIISWAV
jgi:hypothetical protein